MFKKFIQIEGISLQEFKQLLEILNSKELLKDAEKNYEQYIKNQKLKFLMKHNPKKEYFFCDDGLVDNLNLVFYKHILNI